MVHSVGSGSEGDRFRWPLIGREKQRAEFARVLDGPPEFTVVELVGEPGAGKTRLWQEFAEAARSSGRLVLAGRAAEYEQELPLACVVDALGDVLADVVERNPDRIAGRLRPAELAVLASTFPELADPGLEHAASAAGEQPTAPGAETYRLHRAVRRLMECLGDPPGLVLGLDDVHWADPGTVGLIDHLLRHPPAGAITVVLGFRPAQVLPRLAAALGQAPPGRVVSLPVTPFTREETDEFLASEDLPNAYREKVHEVTGGIPFYLDALVRSEDRSLAAIPELDGDVAESAMVALADELGGLSEEVAMIAQAAATAGHEFDPVLVAVAAGVPDEEALAGLGELTRRDLIRLSGHDNRFWFRHPLVRRVVYDRSDAGWLLAAHGRLARHLADVGASDEVLAQHIARSASFGDRDAVARLARAATSVAVRVPGTAATWLLRARDLLPAEGPEDRVQHLMLMAEIARTLGVSGRLAEGRDMAVALLDELNLDEYEWRAIAARVASVMARLLGDGDGARLLLETELARLPESAVLEGIPLLLRLAADSLMRGDYIQAGNWLDRITPGDGGARDDGQSLDAGIQLAVAAMRPMPLIGSGRIPDALDLVQSAGALLDEAADEVLARWLDVVVWLCWAEAWTDLTTGRSAVALRRCSRVVDVTRQTGHSYVAPYALACQALVLCRLGRLTEAADAADEAAETARMLGSGPSLAISSAIAATVALADGDHEIARRWATEGMTAAGETQEWWGALARCAWALVLLETGQVQAAEEVIATARELFERPVLWVSNVIACYELLARAAADNGDGEAARRWSDRAAQTAHPGLETGVAVTWLAHAHVTALTDPAAAAEEALRAAGLFARGGWTLEVARAHLFAGEYRRVAGQKSEARQLLKHAAELVDGTVAATGATVLRLRIVREQRAAGVRGLGGGPGPFGLTAREHEVAKLAAQGLSNAEIARQLYLSVRTVESHLTHAYEKVGVNSRWALARELPAAGG
jgi:DNA-binding CsgD family transcriptional regulator